MAGPLITAGIAIGAQLLGAVLGGGDKGGDAAAGPPNPHLKHPIDYATSNSAAFNNKATYAPGRGFRRLG